MEEVQATFLLVQYSRPSGNHTRCCFRVDNLEISSWIDSLGGNPRARLGSLDFSIHAEQEITESTGRKRRELLTKRLRKGQTNLTILANAQKVAYAHFLLVPSCEHAVDGRASHIFRGIKPIRC